MRVAKVWDIGIFLPEFFSFWLLIWFCYGNRIVLYALTLLSLLSLQPRMWLTLENIKVFCEIQKFPVMIDTFYKCQLCQLIDDDVLVWSTRSDFLLPALSMTEKGTGDQLLYLIIYLDIADLLGGFASYILKLLVGTFIFNIVMSFSRTYSRMKYFLITEFSAPSGLLWGVCRWFSFACTGCSCCALCNPWVVAQGRSLEESGAG